MMNVIEVQDTLKGMPMEQLIREVQMPSGQVPQFLVLSEITRRREMEKAYAQNQGQPQTTVVQDAVAASGVPQEGIAGIARAMAPNTDMAQNTGAAPQAPVQQMASGGYVSKMEDGGFIRGVLENLRERFRKGRMTDEEARWLINNYGILPEKLDPVSSMKETAKEAASDYNEGDYIGAALKTASSLPLARVPGVAVNIASELYDLAPSVEDIPPMGMYNGGYVQKMQAGGRMSTPPIQFMTDPSVREMASRQGVSIEEFWNALSDDAKERQLRTYADTANVSPARMPGISSQPVISAAPSMFGGFSMPPQPAPNIPSAPEVVGISSVYDTPMTAADLLAASAGPSSVLPVRPRGESPAAASVVPESYDDGYQSSAEAMSGLTQEQLDALRAMPAPVDGTAPDAMTDFQENFGVYEDDGTVAGSGLPGFLELAFGRKALEKAGLDVSTPGGRLRDDVQPAGSVATPDAARPPEGQGQDYFGGRAALTPEQRNALVATTPPATPPVKPPAAPRTPRDAGIAGAVSPLEGEIANLLQQREKRAEQDKWLALAQAGMALMSSRQPTFAGALGEAGLTGLEQFRKARDQYEEDRLGLMTAQERLRAARVAAGARSASAAGKVNPKEVDFYSDYAKTLDDRADSIEDRISSLDFAGTEEDKAKLRAQAQALRMQATAERLKAQRLFAGSVVDLSD